MSRWLGGFDRAFGRVARGRVAPLWAGVVAFLICAAVTAYVGIPNADSHDERSYLLAADTFAKGRLTNPPHPMWEHLETFHVLHQPTYMSKYPPGQGLMLALGKVVAGEAVVGAWISTALGAAAIAWALRAWLPARWAFLGGLLAGTHLLLVSWAQSYWGGALGAVGGALVFGGIGRLRRRPAVMGGVVSAVGVAMLLVSRPYEGVLLTGLLMPLLPIRRAVRSVPVWVGAGAVLAVAGAWLGYFNWRVTGDVAVPPYALYEREYSEASPFVWMEPRPLKTYRHAFLQYVFHDSELALFERQGTLEGYVAAAGSKLKHLGLAYFYPSVAAIGLLGLPWVVRRKGATRYVTIVLVVFCGVLTFTSWFFAHYAAPMFSALIFVEMAGLRRLAVRRGVRRWAVPVMLVAAVSVAGAWAKARAEWAEGSWGRNRDVLVRELERQPGGPHLVIVRYQYINNLNHDWVANAADIDSAPVVWARDMGAGRNEELLRYFAGRKAWLMTVVGDDVAVVAYAGGSR